MILGENTYKIPVRVRVVAALKTIWTAIIATLVTIIVTGLLVLDGADINLLIVDTILFSLTTLIGFFIKYTYNPEVTYKINGVKFIFRTTKYYVPPNVMQNFVDKTTESFSVALKDMNMLEDVWSYLEGVTVVVVNPGSFPGKIIGKTNGTDGLTSIRGDYVLEEGGLGYELKLQICNKLFWNRPEKEDIEWMRSKGIL